MTRVKRSALTGLMLMAMLLVGGYAATGASAATPFKLGTSPCTTTGTEKGFAGFCYKFIEEPSKAEVLLEFEGEENLEGTLETTTESLLSATFGEEVAHIVCTGATLTGLILQNSPLVAGTTIDNVVIAFTGCKLLEGVKELGIKCEVPATLTTNAIVGTLEEADPSALTSFKPEAGAEASFIPIPFTSKAGQTCPATVRGTKQVKGKQTCVNVTPETHALVHLIECIETGSELTLGENKAEFKSTFEIWLKALEHEWDISLV